MLERIKRSRGLRRIMPITEGKSEFTPNASERASGANERANERATISRWARPPCGHSPRPPVFTAIIKCKLIFRNCQILAIRSVGRGPMHLARGC